MTWRELSAFISKMPSSDIDQPVRFVEPYDDGGQGYVLEPIVAAEDISLGNESSENVFVKAGETLLA